MQPLVLNQLPDDCMLSHDAVYRRFGRFNKHAQAQGRVLPGFAIVQRLHRQANAQITAIAFKHTQPAAHHVVQHLVAAAIFGVVNHAGVVLHVDPVGHHHRGGHDEGQHAQFRVLGVVVVVQKRASRQIQMLAACARRNDEGGVVGQAPFRPNLRPVISAGLDGFLELLGVVRQMRQA